MTEKDFIHQRICGYLGNIDINSDQQVKEVLRNRFNIYLPQRKNIMDSLRASISDHEILGLLIQYRAS